MGRRTLEPNDPITKDLQEVVSRLRKARDFRGLSAYRLSLDAGMSHATVAAIEGGGVTQLEVATLYRLADALRVRRAWLLTGDGDPDLPPAKKTKP